MQNIWFGVTSGGDLDNVIAAHIGGSGVDRM
jgi:hypothetical protein